MAVRSVVLFAAVVALSACGSGSKASTVMPDVMGRKLDVALSDIERAGIDDEVEILGGGTFGIVDESNWTVCEQLPPAGKSVDVVPRLSVDRSCPGDAVSTTTSPPPPPTTAAAATPAPAQTVAPVVDEVLTADNNQDLAAILKVVDTCDASLGAFAATYRGRTISFDGTVEDVASHDGQSTRFDFLVRPASSGGPNFQFRDKNGMDLNLSGPNVPDAVRAGTNVRVAARVDEFVQAQCLLLLTPVMTVVR